MNRTARYGFTDSNIVTSSKRFLPGRLGNGPGIPDVVVDVVVEKVGCGRRRGKGSNFAGGGGAKKKGSWALTMSVEAWMVGGV